MEVTLTVQVGGSDANEICSPLIVLLRKSLKLIQDDYSSGLDKFRLQMRISGNVTAYKEETGIHYIRLMKKKNYVTGEIILGREAWGDKTNLEIASVFCKYTEKLFLEIINELKANQIPIEDERLISDLRSVVLKQFGSVTSSK